jgi:hypothetical protein
VVISIGASAAGHQTDFLFELARVLKPSGSLVLREPLLLGSKVLHSSLGLVPALVMVMMMMGSPRERQEGIVTALRTESEVESALLISGFTSTTFQNTQGASSVASFPALNGSADVQTQVATYEVRASWPTHLSASVLSR